jgi:hypothetical protein
MPEVEPRKGLSGGILLWFGLLMLLVLGVVLVARAPSSQAGSASLVLPDGTKVSVVGVSYGTNHVFGSRLARLVARLPDGVQNILTSVLGARASASQTTATTTPTLVVWLYSPIISTPAPGRPAPGMYEVYAGDRNGFVSGASGVLFLGYGGLGSLQLSAFPRREPTFILHVYQRNAQGKMKECGVMEVSNPVYRSYPQWQPEALPASKRVGDVAATLEQFRTGLGNNMGESWLQDGRQVIEFETNREGGQNETACLLRLRPLTDTNQVWQVDHVELSDATGNVLPSSGMTWGGAGEVFGFSPGLWINEAVWKLRCEIKRTRGFVPDELFTFEKVPLGEMNESNYLGWTTNFNGVTVTLDHLIRRPPNTNNAWSTSDLTDASLRVSGLSNDLHLDLVETRADNGTNVECPSSSTSADIQERYLRNVPLEAKSLDFTFAVHQGRWVEFLVKPVTGPARFEVPAHHEP